MTIDRTGRDGRPVVSSATAVPILAVLAVLALVAAGCGGSSSDKKANEAYATSVCSAIGAWEQQIKSIATDFSGGVSKAALQSKITQADTATKTLAKQIKAVPPPNTSDGQAAKTQVDQLSTQVASTVSSAQSAVASHPGQRLGHDRRDGAGTARATGQEPREHGTGHRQVTAEREGIARFGVQECRLVQEPRRVGGVAGRTYQLIVAGELSDQVRAVFEGMTLTRAGGTTTLSGHVRDQAELQGLLQRVSDLGLTLLEVKASGAKPPIGSSS